MSDNTNKKDQDETWDDDFDLDSDLDFGDDDMFGEPKEVVDDRKPVVKLGESAVKAAKDRILDPSTPYRFLKDALPSETNKIVDTVDSGLTTLKGTWDETVDGLKPALREFKRSAREMKRALGDVLPESLSRWIDKKLEDDDGNRNNVMSEEQMREAQVSQTLTEIFKKQNEVDGERRQRDEVMQMASIKQGGEGLGIQQRIYSEMQKLTSFQDSIGINAQKKMLELSIRQWQIQAALLKGFSEHKTKSTELLESIVKNTALPDLVKQRSSEYFKQLGLARLFNGITDTIGSKLNLGTMMNSIIKVGSRNLKDNFTTNFSDVLTSFSDAMNMVGQLRENEEAMADFGDVKIVEDDQSKLARMVGDQAGSMVADNLLHRGAKWLGRKAGEFEFVRKVDEVARRANNEGAFFLNDLLRRGVTINDNDNVFKKGFGKVFNFVNDTLGLSDAAVGESAGSVKNQTESNQHELAEFNNWTQRSITEIIPGYLARILASVEGIRTGKVPPLTVFSQARDKFITETKLEDDVRQQVMSVASGFESQLERTAKTLLGTSRDYDKLLPEEKESLERTLLAQARRAEVFDPVKFLRDNEGKMDEAVRLAIIRNLKENYGYIEGKGFAKDSENYSKVTDLKNSVYDLTRSLPGVQSTIQQIALEGVNSTDALKRLGVLEDGKNGHKILLNNIYDQVLKSRLPDAVERRKVADKRRKEIEEKLKKSVRALPTVDEIEKGEHEYRLTENYVPMLQLPQGPKGITLPAIHASVAQVNQRTAAKREAQNTGLIRTLHNAPQVPTQQVGIATVHVRQDRSGFPGVPIREAVSPASVQPTERITNVYTEKTIGDTGGQNTNQDTTTTASTTQPVVEDRVVLRHRAHRGSLYPHLDVLVRNSAAIVQRVESCRDSILQTGNQISDLLAKCQQEKVLSQPAQEIADETIDLVQAVENQTTAMLAALKILNNNVGYIAQNVKPYTPKEGEFQYQMEGIRPDEITSNLVNWNKLSRLSREGLGSSIRFANRQWRKARVMGRKVNRFVKGKIFTPISNHIDKASDKLLTFDLYFPENMQEAVLKARDFALGMYCDASGNIIRSFRDIKGDVYRVVNGARGPIVVTAEELKTRLVDKYGKAFDITRYSSVFKRAVLGIIDKVKTLNIMNPVQMLRAAKEMAKNAYERGKSLVVKDIFVGKEKTPRITGMQLVQGVFFCRGKRVYKRADIVDDVVDKDGNTIISLKEMTDLGLWDEDGNLYKDVIDRALATTMDLGGIGIDIGRRAFNKLREVGGKVWNAAASVFKGIFGGFEFSVEVNAKWTKRIYEILVWKFKGQPEHHKNEIEKDNLSTIDKSMTDAVKQAKDSVTKVKDRWDNRHQIVGDVIKNARDIGRRVVQVSDKYVPGSKVQEKLDAIKRTKVGNTLSTWAAKAEAFAEKHGLDLSRLEGKSGKEIIDRLTEHGLDISGHVRQNIIKVAELKDPEKRREALTTIITTLKPIKAKTVWEKFGVRRPNILRGKTTEEKMKTDSQDSQEDNSFRQHGSRKRSFIEMVKYNIRKHDENKEFDDGLARVYTEEKAEGIRKLAKVSPWIVYTSLIPEMRTAFLKHYANQSEKYLRTNIKGEVMFNLKLFLKSEQQRLKREDKRQAQEAKQSRRPMEMVGKVKQAVNGLFDSQLSEEEKTLPYRERIKLRTERIREASRARREKHLIAREERKKRSEEAKVERQRQGKLGIIDKVTGLLRKGSWRGRKNKDTNENKSRGAIIRENIQKNMQGKGFFGKALAILGGIKAAILAAPAAIAAGIGKLLSPFLMMGKGLGKFVAGSGKFLYGLATGKGTSLAAKAGALIRRGAVRAVGSTASWIGRGALALATSPTGWAVLGLAAAGYTAYKLWKWYRDDFQEVDLYRLATYGLNANNNTAKGNLILAFEKEMDKILHVDERTGQLTGANFDFKKWAAFFWDSDISGDMTSSQLANEQMPRFKDWFLYRFFPNYKKHREALAKMNRTGLKGWKDVDGLYDIDSNMKDGYKPAYVRMTHAKPDDKVIEYGTGYYEYLGLPFSDMDMGGLDSAQVDTYANIVLNKYQADEKSLKISEDKDKVVNGKFRFEDEWDKGKLLDDLKENKKDYKLDDTSKDVLDKVSTKGGLIVGSEKITLTNSKGEKKEFYASEVASEYGISGGLISDWQAFRLYAYGYDVRNGTQEELMKLLALERAIFANQSWYQLKPKEAVFLGDHSDRVDDKFTAEMQSKLADEWITKFGYDNVSEDRKVWLSILIKRVWLAMKYIAGTYVNFGVDKKQDKMGLNNIDKWDMELLAEIAQDLYDEGDFRDLFDIVNPTLFKGKPMWSDYKVLERFVKNIKEGIKSTPVKLPMNKEERKQMAEKFQKAVEEYQKKHTKAIEGYRDGEVHQGAQDAVRNQPSSTFGAFGQNVASIAMTGKPMYTTPNQHSSLSGTSASQAIPGVDANTYEGVGGDIQGIQWQQPAEFKSKDVNHNFQVVKGLLAEVSKMVGVDAGVLTRMGYQESKFDANAKASTTSATGLFQFLKGTWNDMQPKLRKYGAAGLPPTHPVANALAGAIYLKDNLKTIKSAVERAGVSLGGGPAYVAHFMGPGGAKQLYNAIAQNPNQIAAQLFPAPAKANPSIFYKDKEMRQPRTVAELESFIAETKMLRPIQNKMAAEVQQLAGQTVTTPTTTTPRQRQTESVSGASTTTPAEIPVSTPDASGTSITAPNVHQSVSGGTAMETASDAGYQVAAGNSQNNLVSQATYGSAQPGQTNQVTQQMNQSAPTVTNLGGVPVQPNVPVSSVSQGDGAYTWIQIAFKEVGVQEKQGTEFNPRIMEYHNTAGLSSPPKQYGSDWDEVPWCASFVHWVMHKAGYQNLCGPGARNWANWKDGQVLSEPAYGAIMVMKRNKGGHVGFVVGKSGGKIAVLGGNQSNSVRVCAYSTENLICYVLPKGVTPITNLQEYTGQLTSYPNAAAEVASQNTLGAGGSTTVGGNAPVVGGQMSTPASSTTAATSPFAQNSVGGDMPSQPMPAQTGGSIAQAATTDPAMQMSSIAGYVQGGRSTSPLTALNAPPAVEANTNTNMDAPPGETGNPTQTPTLPGEVKHIANQAMQVGQAQADIRQMAETENLLREQLSVMKDGNAILRQIAELLTEKPQPKALTPNANTNRGQSTVFGQGGGTSKHANGHQQTVTDTARKGVVSMVS